MNSSVALPARRFSARPLRVAHWPWLLYALVLATLVLIPVSVVLLSWSSDQTELWQHLIATQLSTLLGNTAILLVGVGLGVTSIGVALAWVTVMCDFPGRRFFSWALMLPLAIPAYVLAFVALGLLEYAGPVQTLLRSLFGDDFAIREVRGPATVIVVLTSVLYPYVYMLARSAFLSQGTDVVEAARSLGLNPWQAFFRVALPMARPAIVAGLALALMETLADFGAVSIFNYDTFTTAIYKAWFAFFNLQAAAQLASLLLLLVSLALFAERKARGRGHYYQSHRRHSYRFNLSRKRAWMISAGCALLFALTFVIPVIQLLYWIISSSWHDLNMRLLVLYRNTVTLALSAALVAAVLALLMAYARKQYREPWLGRAMFVATLGYALPGTVLAVGLVLPLGYFEQQLQNFLVQFGVAPRQWLLGSVYALLIGYIVRFLTVALGPLDSSFAQIRPSIPEAALSLGARRWEIIWRVYIPMIRPGLLTALLLVFVDVMKEMPITLLMRPFGWDTLAVRIFELTSEGEWQRAALPALTLVLVGLIPVYLVIRRSGASQH